MLWENIISNDFPKAVEEAKGVCVVPIGCLEKHGPHLPLGTDVIHAEGLSRLACEKTNTVMFPTMYFGEKSGAGEYPGTVIFSLETRWAIYKETCREIYRNGFRKILFCNGHGGNGAMLNCFSRAMMQELPQVSIFNMDFSTDILEGILAGDYPYLTQEDRAEIQDFIDEKKVHGHACMMETGWVHHFRPETVHYERATWEDGLSTHRFDEFRKYGIQTHYAWMGNYPNSYSASNDFPMNERMSKAMVEYSRDFTVKAIEFLKEETISDEYHKEWLAKQ